MSGCAMDAGIPIPDTAVRVPTPGYGGDEPTRRSMRDAAAGGNFATLLAWVSALLRGVVTTSGWAG